MNKFFLFTAMLLLFTAGCKQKTKSPLIQMVRVECSKAAGKINKPFYIGKFEVTFKQYDEFCRGTGKNRPYDRGWGRENRPVINTYFADDAEFCNWLSKREGYRECYKKTVTGGKTAWICDFTANGYRLPTLSEWEYAAAGGDKTSGYKYSGSSNIDEAAWYEKNSGGETHEAGSKAPNELGIYDMSGNVFERCWDETGKGNQNLGDKIVKGGAFDTKAIACETGFILHINSGYATADWGFRAARNAE